AQRAGLPGRPARGPDRPRGAGGRGRGAGQGAGPAGGDAGGVPVIQRGPGHRRADPGRATAAAVRGRGADRAGRRRPAAVRLAAGGPVRHRPPPARLRRPRAGRPGPAVDPGLGRTQRRAQPPAGRDRRLAGRPGTALIHIEGRVAGLPATLTSTGSMSSRTPNAVATPSWIWWARASRLAVLAPPGLTRASVCLLEMR